MCRWNFMCRETSKHGPGLLPTKRKFHLPIPTFQGDFAVGFREGKTFRVIQTMHYYNGNPSRKTKDDSSQNRSPLKFHDHSCRFFSTIPSIKPSKRILANWSFGTSTTHKTPTAFFWGKMILLMGWQPEIRLPTHQFEVEVVYPIICKGLKKPSNRWLALGFLEISSMLVGGFNPSEKYRKI